MIGNNLKKIRESKNMSQEYVAKALNISRQSISKWENDRVCPDINNLKSLSMLYKVSIDELVGKSIEEERQPDHTEKVSKELVEMLLAVAVMLASTLIPPIGIAAAAVIFVKTRKNSYPKIFYILCLICFLVNIYNCYIIMDSLFFKFGIVTIQ